MKIKLVQNFVDLLRGKKTEDNIFFNYFHNLTSIIYRTTLMFDNFCGRTLNYNKRNKQKALFINSKNKECSIHESGLMIYDCIKNTKLYDFDYIEIDSDFPNIPTGYDLYFFNYHFLTMKWIRRKNIKKIFKHAITVVLEVLPNNPFPYYYQRHFLEKDDFDAFCVIDPTIETNNKDIFAFPRPLEKYTIEKEIKNEIPVIGSFGFPAKSKRFDDIVEAVNKEFDRAVVRINMPKSTGCSIKNFEEIKDYYVKRFEELKKDGIEIQFTSDFMDKNKLIDWLAHNDLNCFFYQREEPGLSATTDQAITVGKPLLVSDCPTFRHIHKYIKPYPKMSLKEAIEKTPDIVKQIQQDWSQEAFLKKFEEMMNIINLKPNGLRYCIFNKKINLGKI